MSSILYILYAVQVLSIRILPLPLTSAMPRHSKAHSPADEPVEPDVTPGTPEETNATQPEEDDYKERWQRALADLENLRRRADIERQDTAKYALKSFIEDLLPVIDNFYRATEHVPAELKDSPWVAGMLYIQKNLLDTLESRGVKEIPAKNGDQFDPTHHEGIQTIESDEQPDHSIKVINRGYMLHDRILRPVQVAVYSNQAK